MRLTYITLLAVLITMSACTTPEVKPAKYASPTQGALWEPSKTFQNKPKEEDRLPGIIKEPDINYNKMILAELVDLALRNNLSTRVAWATAKAAATQWGIEKGAYYPTLSGSAAGAVGELPLTTGGENYIQAGAMLSYLLYDFGGREAAVKSAKQALIAANWTHNQAIQDILRDVPQAFHTYIADKAQLKASYQDLKEADMSLKSTELRKRSGVSTIADVLQARATRAQVMVSLAAAKGAVQISKGNLANAVGWPSNAEFDVNVKTQRLPLNKVTKDVNALIDQAKVHRPDINAYLATVKQNEALVRRAQSAYFPTFTGTGNIQWMGNKTIQDTSYYGGVQMSVSLFEGFALRNAVRKARAELEAARANLLLMEENVTNQVWSSFYNYKTSTEQYTASQALLSSASESFKVSSARYRAGAADIVELLDAQKTLADARSQLINSRMSLHNTFADLIHSVGTINAVIGNDEFNGDIKEQTLSKK